VDLHDASDQNIAAALRHFATHAEGAELSETSGTLLVAAAAPFTGAFHNAAFRLDPRSSPHSVLEDLSSFATRHNRDLVLWASTTRDDDLVRAALAAGLCLRSSTIGMAIEQPPSKPVLPAGIELHHVTDEAGATEYAAVHEQVFRESGRPLEPVAHFASPPALLAPDVEAFVVRSEALPLACAMTVLSGPQAGIYWVATRTDARRRGFAELATRVATRAAFEHGAHAVVLQSSPQAEPLYQRLGFTPFTHYSRY
jgi:ribosomal protein S18 acetylase RimI-like enzyme